MQNGVLYVASSSKLQEVERSIGSLRMAMPHVHIGLITNSAHRPQNVDVFIGSNDFHSNLSDKVFNLRKMPFQRKIYLDTDTIVNQRLDGIFELLEQYDIVAAFSDNREYMPNKDYPYNHIPFSFPEYNSGVIGYSIARCDEFLRHGKMSTKIMYHAVILAISRLIEKHCTNPI